jgi:electron transport complex protein RnfG
LLGGVALLASGLLVLGHTQTRAVIAARQAEDLKASLAEVVPSPLYDNDLTQDTVVLPRDTGTDVLAYRGRRGGQVTAVAWPLRAQGYAGPIELVMGLDRAGRIQGVRVLSHTETPGLGDKIEALKSDWVRRFDGLSLANPTPEQWAVKKDGGYFDQFTGATITPRAVVRAVKEGLLFFKRQRTVLLGEAQTAAPKAALADFTPSRGVDTSSPRPDGAAPIPDARLTPPGSHPQAHTPRLTSTSNDR